MSKKKHIWYYDKTIEGRKRLAFDASAAIHTQLKKPDRIWFFDGNISREQLKHLLQNLLNNYNLEDTYITKFLHWDANQDKFDRKEYQKHYHRDYRRFKHKQKISCKDWGIIPKKRGRKKTVKK